MVRSSRKSLHFVFSDGNLQNHIILHNYKWTNELKSPLHLQCSIIPDCVITNIINDTFSFSVHFLSYVKAWAFFTPFIKKCFGWSDHKKKMMETFEQFFQFLWGVVCVGVHLCFFWSIDLMLWNKIYYMKVKGDIGKWHGETLKKTQYQHLYWNMNIRLFSSIL